MAKDTAVQKVTGQMAKFWFMQGVLLSEAFNQACGQNSPVPSSAVLQMLLSYGADPNLNVKFLDVLVIIQTFSDAVPTFTAHIDIPLTHVQDRVPTLHLVAAIGRIDAANILLSHSARLNAEDSDVSVCLRTQIQWSPWAGKALLCVCV